MSDLGWKEGMANWVPLSQLSEFAPEPMPPLPAEVPPVEGAEEAGVAQTKAGGLPWDYRSQNGYLASFIQTVRMVLTQPSEAFARMRVDGSLFSPLVYCVIGGWLGMVVTGIYAVITARTQPMPGDLTPLQARFYPTPAMAMTALQIFIFLGPVIAMAIALISSFIAHLFLMLAGGANKPFHVTLRVFAFSYGSTELLKLLPACGSPLAMVWLMVCCVVGLAVAHQTTTRRSVAAMLLFVLACFMCCMGFLFLFAAMSYDALRPMLNR